MMCHSKAKKMVDAGITSWEELATLKLANRKDEADPFTKAFNEAKGK